MGGQEITPPRGQEIAPKVTLKQKQEEKPNTIARATRSPSDDDESRDAATGDEERSVIPITSKEITIVGPPIESLQKLALDLFGDEAFAMQIGANRLSLTRQLDGRFDAYEAALRKAAMSPDKIYRPWKMVLSIALDYAGDKDWSPNKPTDRRPGAVSRPANPPAYFKAPPSKSWDDPEVVAARQAMNDEFARFRSPGRRRTS